MAVKVATIVVPRPPNYAPLECPVWSPSGDALAYVDTRVDSSTIYLVRWSEQGPEEPMPILELDGYARLEMLRTP